MPMCPQGQGRPWANRAMVGRTRSWGNPNHGSPILQILPMRTSASFPRSPGRGHFHREEKGTLLGEIQQLGGSVLLFSRCFWGITLNGDTHIFSSILKNAKKSITKFTPITYFPCLSQGNTFPLLFSRSVVSDSVQPHGLQHVRLPCPSSPRACSNSCLLSQ